MPTRPASFDGLRVEHETAVDRVAAELRRAVFAGELPPGTPLREVALSDSLGVARSTVREALGALVAEGLAVRVPNKGTAVGAPSAAAVRDVCAARTVLEQAGVRAWPEATEELRQGVRDALATYADLAGGRWSDAELNEAHLGFHLALVALTGSERLVATQEALGAEVRLALATVSRSRRNAREQVAEHADLLALLEAGEVDAAAEEVVRHVADGRDSMLVTLGLED